MPCNKFFSVLKSSVMGVDNGLVIFLPHVSDFQAPFS